MYNSTTFVHHGGIFFQVKHSTRGNQEAYRREIDSLASKLSVYVEFATAMNKRLSGKSAAAICRLLQREVRFCEKHLLPHAIEKMGIVMGTLRTGEKYASFRHRAKIALLGSTMELCKSNTFTEGSVRDWFMAEDWLDIIIDSEIEASGMFAVSAVK